MVNLTYLGEAVSYPVLFDAISGHVVQIKGAFPVRQSGFVLNRIGRDDDNWDYSGYTTVYRIIEGGVQFSDDSSIYVAPPEPEPVPEPEPYEPTLQEIKDAKKQEIRFAYQEIKAAGVDVELSGGTERFPLSDEEVALLFGKQFELASGSSDTVSYQDSANRCKFYSRADMQTIIQEAFKFVSYQTTYRNSLWEWVDECSTKEEVEGIIYGCAIPEERQNDVLKSYMAQMEGEIK